MTATAERPITPAYCNKHGYRVYESVCSICAETSNLGVLGSWLSFKGETPRSDKSRALIFCSFCRGHHYLGNCPVKAGGESFSLDTFLAEVKDSCTNHAERKGYSSSPGSDAGDILGNTLKALGIARDHAIGEIIAKLVEYGKTPRRVLAVKAAGWCWRLWLNCEK